MMHKIIETLVSYCNLKIMHLGFFRDDRADYLVRVRLIMQRIRSFFEKQVKNDRILDSRKKRKFYIPNKGCKFYIPNKGCK